MEPSECIINVPSGAIIIQMPLYGTRSFKRCVPRENRVAAAQRSARSHAESQRTKCVKEPRGLQQNGPELRWRIKHLGAIVLRRREELGNGRINPFSLLRGGVGGRGPIQGKVVQQFQMKNGSNC